jgi:peptidoglycan/LPS O-acetylase OafA/YrhL
VSLQPPWWPLSSPFVAATPSFQSHAIARGAKRTDIEGLRGFAVLIVVAFHCGFPWLAGGFIGVDVFFVLSGYLITALLVREVNETGRLDLVGFYARRVRRLLPAAACAVVVTLVIGLVFLAPGELLFAARAGRATALYLNNIFFAVNAADYFGRAVELNPLLHMWSLAVEEQFYLFWPLLIAAAVRLSSRRALVWILALLTAVSFALCIWWTRQGSTWAFYSLPARAWEFSIGGLAAVVTWELSPGAWRAISWTGVLATSLAALRIGTWGDFPGWIVLVPVAGTCLVLMACQAQPESALGRLLNRRPLQILGKLSYSWYLWHWPALVGAAVLVPTITLQGKTIVALGALGIAAVTHRLIENPIRFHPRLVRRPQMSILLGVCLTLVVFAVSHAALRLAAIRTAAPSMTRLAAAENDIAQMPRDRCVTLASSSEVRTCNFGVLASSTRVVLFGDSHAIQWFDAVQQIATDRGWLLTTVVKSGCAAFAIDPDGAGGDRNGCPQWRAAAIMHIRALRPALVLLGSATNRRSKDRGELPMERYALHVREGALHTLQALSGLRLAVIRDVPVYPFDVPTCLARASQSTWYPVSQCAGDARDAALPAALFASEQAAAGAGVTFIDLSGELCSAERCDALTADGEPRYRDNNHLTGRFAHSLAPQMARQIPVMHD